jgi:membrane protein implicated in regulation of membrane protease activity
VKGYVHVVLALVSTIVVVWLSNLPSWQEGAAVLAGAVVGGFAGIFDARSIERRVDASGGLELYDEDVVGFVIPVAILASSPFAFGSALSMIFRSEVAQGGLQGILCSIAAFWLSHDIALGRRLKRLERRTGPLRVRRFYARSIVGPQGLIGQSGEVARSGDHVLVRLRGELWAARAVDDERLIEGEPVVVRHIEGLMLLVERSAPGGAPR